MSKRDRVNRFAESPDFQELPQSGTENKAISSAIPVSAPKSVPIIVENVEKNEDEAYFRRMSVFFGRCWNKITAFTAFLTRATISKPWGWCRSYAQWSWNFLRKIPSYCVIRWNSAEDDELSETISDSKKKSADKNEPAKTEAKPVNIKPIKTVPAVEQYDEDEPTVSGWWSIGIRTAAATAALLILGGGYFALKPLLFPASTSDIETVALTDQILPEEAQESTSDTKSIVAAASPIPAQKIPEQKKLEPVAAPAVIGPMIADAVPSVKQSLALSEPPKQNETAVSEPKQEQELVPSQGTLLANDPFSATTGEPIIAEHSADTAPADIVAPLMTHDPFGTPALDIAAEQPAPTSAGIAPAMPESAPLTGTEKSTSTQPLAALQPLAPLESAPVVDPLPQLQPLVALDPSASTVPINNVAAPAATVAPANAAVASNFSDRRNSRRTNTNPSFTEAPSPPAVVSTIPESNTPSAVPKVDVPITEPVREIVPQILHTGTVEDVPLPVTVPKTLSNTSSAAKIDSVQMMTDEAAPAIPKDAPYRAENVITVPAVTDSATMDESVLPYLPVNESPIDQPLRERLREQRNDAETEPATLRFTTKSAVSEPALRFTPKQETTAVSSVSESNAVREGNILYESVNQFRELLPSGTSNVLSPDSNDIAIVLPTLENAPEPVPAEIRPAYREGQGTREKGMTFQSRIASEIKRSPVETETYIIQQGDTYMTISDRFYGTSLLYSALAMHNQKLGTGWRPAEGVAIEIPTAEYLRTNYGETSHRQERRLEARRSAIRYTVQEGDTIFRLATDKLQDSTRWREIYVLNTDRIQDVRVLQPGMEILLPAETVRLNRQTH